MLNIRKQISLYFHASVNMETFHLHTRRYRKVPADRALLICAGFTTFSTPRASTGVASIITIHAQQGVGVRVDHMVVKTCAFRDPKQSITSVNLVPARRNFSGKTPNRALGAA